jgi:salicylate hydroxylase
VADGVHSRLRNRILGDDSIQAKKMGLTCFRVAASAKAVKETLGSLPHWWEPTTAQNRVCVLESGDGSDRFVVAYPLRDLEYMNLSCIFPSRKSKQSRTNSWYADGNSDEIIEIFSDFDESFRKILRYSDLFLVKGGLNLLNMSSVSTEVKYWELQDIDALPTWTRGRAIVIGDAAHAMTPLQGQGANQAIEDGESFRLLKGVKSKDVPKALKHIDSLRRPRATQVLEDTRGMAREVSWEERMAKYDFLFGYNGIHDAQKQVVQTQ